MIDWVLMSKGPGQVSERIPQLKNLQKKWGQLQCCSQAADRKRRERWRR